MGAAFARLDASCRAGQKATSGPQAEAGEIGRGRENEMGGAKKIGSDLCTFFGRRKSRRDIYVTAGGAFALFLLGPHFSSLRCSNLFQR